MIAAEGAAGTEYQGILRLLLGLGSESKLPMGGADHETLAEDTGTTASLVLPNGGAALPYRQERHTRKEKRIPAMGLQLRLASVRFNGRHDKPSDMRPEQTAGLPPAYGSGTLGPAPGASLEEV